MKTLHIAPSDSAGGSLLMAVRNAGREDEVLRCRDDLSCGPIDADDPETRADWWRQFYDPSEVSQTLRRFWDRVLNFDGHLIAWFGRYRASELALSMAIAEKLGDRPYWIVDVTGRQLPFKQRDGSFAAKPAQCVSIIRHETLQMLLATEEPVTPEDRQASRAAWQRLRRENAPFRIVTDDGLASASIDYFDPSILAQATGEWRSVARVVGGAMAGNSDPYFQVGDLMLHARVVALVEAGVLLAKGDPWDMRSRVRLAA